MKKLNFPEYKFNEYIDKKIPKFQYEIYISFAVCGKNCGYKTFIVDGQTQVCEYCGRLMFRTEERKYRLKKIMINEEKI